MFGENPWVHDHEKSQQPGVIGKWGAEMQKKKGSYLGTEIDRKWWKRYRHDGLFARGNGEFWMDDKGIRFHRLLTRIPLLIHWEEMKLAGLGKWHAGRWLLGRPVLKIDFERKRQKLCAGFYLSEDWRRMAQLAADLNKRIQLPR